MSDAYARRREALRTQLRERGLDALLLVDLLNIRYLTGFTGSNAALVVHAGDHPGDERNVPPVGQEAEEEHRGECDEQGGERAEGDRTVAAGMAVAGAGLAGFR